MVKLLEKIKRTSSSNEVSSTRQKAPVASSSAPQPKSKHQESSRAKASKHTRDVSPQDFDDIRPVGDDGYEEQPRSAEEYAQVWAGYSNERNKENRPAPKRRLLDRQPGARQMRWEDSQDDEAGPSTNKRKYQEPVEQANEEEEEEAEEERREEEEEDEISEDEGFQQDHRVPDPARRLAAPAARRQSPVQDAPSSPKRQQIERPRGNSDREAARRRQQRPESAARASVRREVDNENEDEDEEDYPPPTFPQASLVARVNDAHARSRMNREPQRRVAWSEADSDRLIDGIEQFGCSWSLIAKNVNFDHPRDQVALKDKARNMKVTYLK
jgi:Myb-like DNA-binding domain